MSKHIISNPLLAASLIFALYACSIEQDATPTDDSQTSATTKTTGNVVAADTPEDSLGVEVNTSISFATAIEEDLGLALSGEAEASTEAAVLDLGNGIILHEARLSIASIKFKAAHDKEDEEKKFGKEMKEGRGKLKDQLKKDEDNIKDRIDALKKEHKELVDDADEQGDIAKQEALKAEFATKMAALQAEMASLRKPLEEELDKAEHDRDRNIKWKGPFVFDAISQTVSPELEVAQVKDGSYRRIEFQIKPNRSVEATDKLLNQSLYVEGVAMVGGVEKTFSVALAACEEFKLQGDGVNLSEGVTNSVAVVFDLKQWFADIDFATATADELGVLAVSEDLNTGLYEQIRRNIKASTKFGKDKDRDGKLSASEDAGSGEAAVLEEVGSESASVEE